MTRTQYNQYNYKEQKILLKIDLILAMFKWGNSKKKSMFWKPGFTVTIDRLSVAFSPVRDFIYIGSHDDRWRIGLNINDLLFKRTLFQALKPSIKGVFCHLQTGWLLLHDPLIFKSFINGYNLLVACHTYVPCSVYGL